MPVIKCSHAIRDVRTARLATRPRRHRPRRPVGRRCATWPRPPTIGPSSRSGSTTISTPSRCRRRTSHPRGLDADGGVRGLDQPGAARPDVHLHGLPQPGLPGEGRRHDRRDLRRPGRDGHRRRLVRARVARLRLRLPRAPATGSACSTRACRSCGSSGRPARPRSTASTTRSTARSAARCRSRTAASRCGSPAAASARRCGSPRKYAQYTNFDATPEVFTRKSEILAEHCKDVGTDFDAIVRSANFNVIIGETDKDVADKLAWVAFALRAADRRPSRSSGTIEMLSSGPLVGTPEQIVEQLTELSRPRAGLHDRLLRRRGLRPQQHRAVRQQGHPGARGLGRPGSSGPCVLSDRSLQTDLTGVIFLALFWH